MDRQYMPYFPPGSGRYPPQVKEEPDYSKMGYEDAPGGTFGIKREPGAGFEEPPGGFAANVKVEEPAIKQEFVEPKQEPSDERRGEKRQAVNQYGSPDPKRYRPELGKDHVEDEPEYDKTEVVLDWYNSDLSLKISKDNFLSAQPLTSDGFGYVWHGVRATYGFSHGRVFYEVKVEDHLPVPQLEVEEQHPHVMRCGWSIDDAGLTLGEEPFSYGYGGTAKASTALKFKDYGRPFGKGDVVGCFLDMDSEPIIISFTLNGRNLGMCYEVSHRSLQDKALFPHILTKNCSFKVNFGSEHPWFQPLTRYTFVGHIPLQERVVGTQGPETRQDSEVIMMVGLPACGKTTWIEKYCKENPAKKYYILGTNALIDKMKVNGLPRKRNYHGRWDVLIGKCTNCLNKLLEMSYKRRRNFIIDQTNVYPSARKRKMKGFPGFFRRAMVVCPDDAELKRRTDKQISQEGKNVPDSAIMEMKANFTLPEEDDDHFDSVEFTDLQREEAAKLVEQYSNDAQAAGFTKNRPPRGRGGANFRGGWNRDRRGGSNDRQDRSSSGSQDNRSSSNNRGGYSRDSFGGNSRGSDNSRGGFGRDNWSRDANRGGFGGRGGDSNRGGFGGRGGDSNRGGFGGRGGDSNRGGFGERGGDSNRGGFGERGGDSNRGGFGERGSFGGGNRDRDNRDFGRDNGSSHRGYGRDGYGGNDRNTQSSRDNNSYGGGFGQSNFGGSRDSQRGFDSNRSRFSTESFSGNSRGGFGQDNLGGNRDMQQGFESNRGGFGQESLGGNRDMQRGFNVDSRDNRGSSNSHGGYIRDNYSGSNKDLDRGYNNMDNRDNTNGGSDARGGFNRDSQRSMDRDYSRSGSDSYGGFSGSTRSFSSDRDRDSRGDGDSRGGYSRDSYGGSSRDGQRGYGSYDSSRSVGATRGSQDHTDSSGYSSLSSSTSSLSSGSSWNRQYSQQQYWGQSDGGYGSQQSSGSSQQSYARSSDRSSPGGGSGSGGGAGAGAGAAAAGGGGGGGGWQQGNSGNWGGGSGSGNPQWNYSSSYRGQRQ